MNAVALRRRFVTLGWSGVLRHYAWRALHHSGTVELDLAFALTPTSVLPIDIPVMHCAPLDLEALQRHAGIPGSGLAQADIGPAVARGDWCFGVFDGDLLASHLWLSTRPTLLRPGLLVHFDPRYAYSFWAFTRTEYRGRHLHALGKSRALEACRRLGLLGVLSLVRADNAASLASAARVGCRRVGSLLAFGRRHRPWVARSPGCRAFGLRLEAV